MENIEAIDFQYLSDRARAYIMGLEAKLKEKNLRIRDLEERLNRPEKKRLPPPFRVEVAASFWSALGLDVVGHHVHRGTTNRSGEVGAGPQVSSPQVLGQVVVVQATQVPGTDTLQRVHQGRQLHRGGKLHQQVHVVVLAVELHQGDAEVVAHLAHDSLAVAEHGTGERTATVLGDEHQMGVALPNSVPTASNRVLVIHDTNGTIGPC